MTDDLQEIFNGIRKLSNTITDPRFRLHLIQDLQSAIRAALVAQSAKNQQAKPYQNTMPPPSNAPTISKLKPNKNRKG